MAAYSLLQLIQLALQVMHGTCALRDLIIQIPYLRIYITDLLFAQIDLRF